MLIMWKMLEDSDIFTRNTKNNSKVDKPDTRTKGGKQRELFLIRS